LNHFLGYDTPLFGEQYIEEVKDSLGTHNVIRYRDVNRTDSPTYWKPSTLEANQRMRQPGPLFKKLDESVIEEERDRLGK
ncbi:MAG TPA: methionine--tRNA ligase, partial [Anaerolineales bacterium]|nr:methionine--tRNA ligase [Anaerolineales bacterium]